MTSPNGIDLHPVILGCGCCDVLVRCYVENISSDGDDEFWCVVINKSYDRWDSRFNKEVANYIIETILLSSAYSILEQLTDYNGTVVLKCKGWSNL